MPKYRVHEYGSLQYLTFPVLEDTGKVIHGFSTRRGGVSASPYDTLNLGLHVGDDPVNVLENRRRMGLALGIDYEQLAAGAQVHGDKVFLVTPEKKGCGAKSDRTAIAGVDALVTNHPGVPLASYYADCVPVYIFDPENCVIALAHAGWKGSILRIAKKTVEKMRAEFGSLPQNCLAVTGPSIGDCCYLVGKEVVDRLKTEFNCWEQFVKKAGDGWHLDLKGLNLHVLIEAGLKHENVNNVDLCTSCSREMFFSHRRSNGKTGRMGAFMVLK